MQTLKWQKMVLVIAIKVMEDSGAVAHVHNNDDESNNPVLAVRLRWQRGWFRTATSSRWSGSTRALSPSMRAQC
jgi:hypothetical protein